MSIMCVARAASALGIIGVAVGGLAACGSGDDGDSVTPSVELIDHTKSGLGATAVQSINGTYTGCFQRSGAWSVLVSGTNALTNPALSVVLNDTSCVLSITSIVADQTYNGAASMALSTAYATTATSFSPASGGAIAFNANAKLSAVDFAANFTLSLIYSDDLSSTTAPDVTGQYTTVAASSVVAVSIAAPNYTISLTSGTPLTFTLDAQKNVQSVAGNVTLTDGTVTGTAYVVDLGTLGTTPTYLTVGLAYTLQTEHTYSGSNPTIPAANLGLVGQNLTSTVVRTIMVSHTVSGVKSYQLFKISFKAS